MLVRAIALIAGLMTVSAGAQPLDFPMVPGSGPMLGLCMPMMPNCGPMGSGPGSGSSKVATQAPTVTAVIPNNGPTAGGSIVTVTGTQFIGLTGASAVVFGATNAASYTVLSPTALQATTPAGSGTVDVRVTNPIGTSAIVVADQFTYTTGCSGLPADFSNPCSIAVLVATMGM